MTRYVILSLLFALASSGVFAQDFKQWGDTAWIIGVPTFGTLTKKPAISEVDFCNIRTSCKDKPIEETTINDWAMMQFDAYCTSDTTLGLAIGSVYVWVDGDQKRGDSYIGESGYDFILKIPEYAKFYYKKNLDPFKINQLDSWSSTRVAELVKGIVIPKSVSYINPRILYDAKYADRISVEEGTHISQIIKAIASMTLKEPRLWSVLIVAVLENISRTALWP